MNFAGRLNITVTVQSPTGSGTGGSADPSWGAQRSIRARKAQVRIREFTAQGEAYRLADVLVTDQALALGDRYWDPGDDVNNALLAKKVGKVHKGATFGGYTLYYAEL